MIIIGEKINATLKLIKRIIRERDEAGLIQAAREQAEAGAAYVDVNVGTGDGSREDEMDAMRWAVTTIQAEVETPLAIDSADPSVLEAGMKAREGRPSLVNSTKAGRKSLESIVPIAVEHEAPLVGLCMDDSGMPKSVQDRVDTCRKIADFCETAGMSSNDIFFDPLLMPVSTDIKQGRIALDSLAAIKKEFPTAKTTLGLSNVSFGLPDRSRVNAGFLIMAVTVGLDSAIMDPLNTRLQDAIATAEVLAGRDRHCRRYMRRFRS